MSNNRMKKRFHQLYLGQGGSMEFKPKYRLFMVPVFQKSPGPFTIHHAGGCSVKVVEDFGGGGVALSSTRPPRELERKVARAELVTPYILFVV